MSLTKLFQAGHNKLFPARESLVDDIPAEHWKIANLILQCNLYVLILTDLADWSLETKLTPS
jgi:hypothetical protein